MLLADLPRVLLRRWYVVAVGLVATVGLCLLASLAVPAQYTGTAEVLLLPSKTETGRGGNPYAGLAGLGPAGAVLAKSMSDDATHRALRDAGLTSTYEIGPDSTSAAPLLLITVTAEAPQVALTSLDLLLARVPTTLRQLQQALGVDQGAFISSTVVTRSSRAAVLRTPQLRALIVAAFLGVAVTLFGTALLDVFLLNRVPRRPAPVDVSAVSPRGPGSAGPVVDRVDSRAAAEARGTPV